jgi:hypothetical protein
VRIHEKYVLLDQKFIKTESKRTRLSLKDVREVCINGHVAMSSQLRDWINQFTCRSLGFSGASTVRVAMQNSKFKIGASTVFAGLGALRRCDGGQGQRADAADCGELFPASTP